MTTKKLISFTDEQLEGINNYAESYKKTFTEAVRLLLNLGLKQQFGEETETITFVSDGITEKLEELEGEIKKLSWWTSDDNTSRLGNLETHVDEMQKSVTVLTAAMKLFKKHVKDRSIHLQD
jgi:sorbitol-specific phosphotransferase system component IIA